KENVLLDWITHLGLLAQPLDRRTVGPFVKDLCGTLPGKCWLWRFLQHHNNEIRYCRSSALDPKHAHSFNYSAVCDYFNKLKTVLDEHDIPWENVYNMDEKGCQL
ncbi:hypothetical protein BS47DRAFT_1277272, partial [Hydnum rufescens UP504]